ncbi:MAG TPA: hypothetical protein DDY20_00190 [Desulfobulbaceae bacterium]|jgi:hypothetical protein|nr:hypothetical protein [Desulfobulbaceae bacterium]
MKRFCVRFVIVPLFVLCSLQTAQAADALLFEGFADITTLAGAGWAFSNQSDPVGATGWFQGNDTVFPAQAGDPTAYIGANYNGTAGAGTISTWLITPPMDFG